MAVRSRYLLLVALMFIAGNVADGIGKKGKDAKLEGCRLVAPAELHVEYSADVDVEFASPDMGSDKRVYAIVLDGTKVGDEMRCPSSFKLRGLSPGKHKLEMISEALGKKGLAVSCEFWVAAEDFWEGGKFSPPTVGDTPGGREDQRDGGIMFWTIIPAHNAHRWIGFAIASVRAQSHSRWRCIVIDDASNDGTEVAARKAASGDDRIKVIRNRERKGAARNFYETLLLAGGQNSLVDGNFDTIQDEDVVVVLDGDDWLADDGVFSHLSSRVYSNSSCWMSYGSLVYFPMGVASTSPDFGHDVVASSSYREHVWISTHLRTSKYKLWRRLKEQTFKGPEGDWLDMTIDMATMFSLLEMAAGRHCAVAKTMYVYNMANPINDFRVSEERQLKLERYIRGSNKSYPLLWW